MAVIRIKGKGRKRHFLIGASGKIGETFSVKQYKDKIVLANLPRKSKKKPSQAQKTQRRYFKDAQAYAMKIIHDPLRKAAYARKLKGRRTVYNYAISEYMMGDPPLVPDRKSSTRKRIAKY